MKCLGQFWIKNLKMNPKPFPRRITTEQGLFCLAFVLALAVRLYHLGQATLTDYESGWALQSLDIALGKPILAGPQPALVVWNSAVFYLFDASNFAARVLPAIAGAFLVITPAFFRRRLGKAALLASFLLVFDPGLVAISRQVDGRMFALTFSILAWASFENHKRAQTGIFLGLALLGGPSVWLGWLIFGAALALNLLFKNQPKDILASPEWEEKDDPSAGGSWFGPMAPWVVGTILAAGSLFFLVPEGLSAIAASLLAFLQGGSGRAASITQVSLALPVYAPFVLVLGLIGLVRGILTGDKTTRQLSIWLLVSILVIALYQDRRVADLVWAAIPLILLAAIQLAVLWERFEPRRLVFVFSGLFFVLLVFMWMQLISTLTPTTETDLGIRWITILGALILLGLALALMGWGWNFKDALQSLTISVCFLLLLFTLANTSRAAGAGPRPEQELWRIGPKFQEADLLERTAGDLSEWKTGRRNWLDLEISGIDRPALRWLFRNQVNISFTNSLAPDSKSALIITRDQPTLAVSSPYSGQDFVVAAQPAWQLFSAAEWARWIVYREGPLEKESIVLWARPDVFPGAAGVDSKIKP
jgi:hypothetical protein